MADGSSVPSPHMTPPETLDLDEAIARLEAGDAADFAVDLGNGRTALAVSARGADGLLQRLRGHRMMMALASGAADLSRFPQPDVTVSPNVQEILDAATTKR